MKPITAFPAWPFGVDWLGILLKERKRKIHKISIFLEERKNRG
jgi:hypothetical protein